MKNLFICSILLFSFLSFTCAQDISQFVALSRDLIIYTFNATTGDMTNNKQSSLPENKYQIEGYIAGYTPNGNGFAFLGWNKETKNDCMVEYDIDTNTYVEKQCVVGSYMGFVDIQPVYYDSERNFITYVAQEFNAQNPVAQIVVWNFTSGAVEVTDFPSWGVINQNTIYPAGYYDQSTGYLHIIYAINQKAYEQSTFLIVYDVINKITVQQPMFFNLMLHTPEIFYYNGQTYFIESYCGLDFKIYQVDLESRTFTLITTIPNVYLDGNFDNTYGVKGNSIIFISRTAKNHVMLTTYNFETMTKYSTPTIENTTKFDFEFCSGAQ